MSDNRTDVNWETLSHPPTPPKPENLNFWWVFLLLLAVIAIIALIYYFCWSKDYDIIPILSLLKDERYLIRPLDV